MWFRNRWHWPLTSCADHLLAPRAVGADSPPAFRPPAIPLGQGGSALDNGKARGPGTNCSARSRASMAEHADACDELMVSKSKCAK